MQVFCESWKGKDTVMEKFCSCLPDEGDPRLHKEHLVFDETSCCQHPARTEQTTNQNQK